MSVWLIWSWFGLFGFKTLLFVNLNVWLIIWIWRSQLMFRQQQNPICSSDQIWQTESLWSVSDQITSALVALVMTKASVNLDCSFDQSSRPPNHHKSRSIRCVSALIYRLLLSAMSVRPPRLHRRTSVSGFVIVVVCPIVRDTKRSFDTRYEQPECPDWVVFINHEADLSWQSESSLGRFTSSWFYATIVPWFLQTVTHVQHTYGGRLLAGVLTWEYGDKDPSDWMRRRRK